MALRTGASVTNVVRALGFAATLGVALAGISACDDSRGPDLIVDVGPAAGRCAIRGVGMNCDEAPLYLRSKLNLPLDTYIAVRSLQEVPTHEAMAPVVEVLEAAGYGPVIGLVEVRSGGPKN